MFSADFSGKQMIAHLEAKDSDEYARILYCFLMGFILPMILQV
jgi:hypothetical protein